MIFGANWTSPRHLPIIRALRTQGRIDFCEVMIDNFIHLSPDSLKSAFPETPLSFHIMNSQFMRRDAGELKSLASKLKAFIRELSPTYVSDHLADFSHAGRRYPFPQEIDYHRDHRLATDRVKQWQETVGTRLLFENYPSILDQGRAQPEFLDSLVQETGAGLLLDLSNAVVARLNCGLPLAAWTPLIQRADRFHAAGYRTADTQPPIVQDSHDCELSVETLSFMRRSKPLLDGRECSIVIERDAEIAVDSWSKDIAAARAALA
ncbi:MAG: DUF692 family multinuclear iron-containing protein [Elusimicrobiota bacterium]